MLKKFVFVVIVVVIVVLAVLGYQKYGAFSLKDRAWLVLQEYLKAAKEHDIEKIKTLSYQIGESCNNYNQTASSTDDCNDRMDTVHYFGNNLKRGNFKNTWSDSKQIILTTDLKREENETAIFLSRAIIYFIIDEDGNIKLLKFNDSKGVSMLKEDRSVEEIDAYNQKRMVDTDKDGLEDEVEECLGQSEPCVKTDPKNRDTDSDGFWDGIQAQFIKS